MSVDVLLKRTPTPTLSFSPSPNSWDDLIGLYRYDAAQEAPEHQRIAEEIAPAAYASLHETLHDLCKGPPDRVAGIKLLIPTKDCYVSRSDAIESRLRGCILVDKVKSFVEPLQHIKAATQTVDTDDIFAFYSEALGGATVRSRSPTEVKEQLAQLESEFVNRLSYGWLLDRPLPRRRLAFVQGRADAEGSIEMWRSAVSLGISLVIFDAEGHWMQDPASSGLREAFVPVDITPDSSLPERLIQAMKGYGKPFDGIMTVSDARLPAVARVAEALGFTTNPSEAYDIAGDKYLTRKLEPSASESFQCTSVEQLHTRLQDFQLPPLKYPLIVKPCTGWGSECVSRVDNETMLVEAVSKACARHQGSVFASTGCVVEPYISGPEFDVNFVLFEGEILFSEISDDYPSRGDSNSESAEPSARYDFLETQVVSSSQLPASEQSTIRKQIHSSIMREGFRSGVFHCEGRMRDSTVEFKRSPATGHFELVPTDTRTADEPSAYLVENNARPPGYMTGNMVCLTYGVDYYGLQMLFALGPGEVDRFRGLAMPFRNGAQYYSMVQYVSPTRSGVLLTEDPGRDLIERCPELMSADNVALSWSPLRKGDKIKGPESKEVAWLSRYIVTSRRSLTHLLDLGSEIVKQYKYEVADEETN
ncbi:hypothetical protein F5B17DRAFT_404327 [Nemania serpens]|nr:hypothetical protein F5B17DRAFT_404327 [Nemania serpens]